jgi:hypothetical protein
MKILVSKIISPLLLVIISLSAWGQLSITTANTPVTQNFDGLPSSGAGLSQSGSIFSSGWSFLEGSTNANATYDAGTGSSNAGNTYSFGIAGVNAVTDRSFGMLQSGSLTSILGFKFTNNTGTTVTSLTIGYTGEVWRLSTAADNLACSYQLAGVALNAASGWTTVAGLAFNTPSTGTAAAVDGNASGNRIVITPVTITGLSIATGTTVTLRWVDATAASSAGMGIDDFTITLVSGCTAPTLSISGTATACSSVSLTASGTGTSYIWSGGSSPSAAGNTFSSSGTYTVTSTLSGCSSTASASVTVNSPPTLSISGTTTGCSNVSLTASGTGTSYLWSGGSTPSSASNTFTTSGTYSVIASLSGCTASASAVVTVSTPPANPAGTITPTLNPACTSTTLAYSPSSANIYWETTAAGTSTANATTSPYTLSSTGAIYARTYNGTCWSAGSVNSGAVTINTPVSITTQPSAATVTVPASATFAVVASGTISSYQWQYNDGTNGWLNTTASLYSGAATATLTISPSSASISGFQYRCIVKATSPCTDVTSGAAVLTVNPAPCVSESFANICTSACSPASSTYGTRTWTGDNGFTWTALLARTDQTINANAITTKSTLTSATVAGGIGSITMTTYLPFSDPSGSLTVAVNGTPVGTIPYSSSIQTSSISGINISGNVIVVISSPSGARVSIDDISWTCYSGCNSPDAIAFVSQPSNVAQDAAMSPVTVRAYCSASGSTATAYTGAVKLTVSGGGCGYTSQTANAVAGVATFSTIQLDRSVQSGITLTASAAGFSSVVSTAFNVLSPVGTPTNTIIINENFDGSSPSWSYTSSVFSDNTALGSSFVGLKDYTTNPYGNSPFKQSLVKSHTANNSSSQGESTNQILFSNIMGLGVYNSVQASFLVGSLPSLLSGAAGNGTDANENLIIETSLDNGTTWNALLKYYGSSNYLLPLSTTSPVVLAYNANAAYNANHANTSTQSAFVINLPSGTSQFQIRMTATDNREEENWAIDNIQIIGTITPTGVPKPLPSAAGSSYSTCANTNTAIGVALTNTQGAVSYSWSPAATLAGAATSGPIANTPATQTYTVTATDADGCTATASDIVAVTTPSGTVTLAGNTMTAVEVGCPDATGWTYYADPANLNNWVFAIYKNGNTFTANVDLTIKTAAPVQYDTKTNSTLKKAVYAMGRYWNVTMAMGNINGATSPVKARFFYNAADLTQMNTAATTQATAWGLSTAQVNGIEWFKTNTGITYDPANNTYSDVPNKLNPTSFTTSMGTIGGISYVEYDGLQGFSGGGAGIRVSPGGYALPVELIFLTASPIANDFVRLNWVTASETDNNGFDIERSSDGINFKKIGFVKGNGTTSVESQYLFEDKNVSPNAVYYYRLRQIDNDDNSEYTTIVSAMLISHQGFVMEGLKPNPATNQVVINAVAAQVQSATVSVTDMLGRVVLSQDWQLSAGLNGTQLDISGLSAGTYSVTVRSVNDYYTKRLAVTK